MVFITEDFLLQNKAARNLYHTYAANQPILDYHGHLPVKDIAQNRRFRNLAEIWLEGDHYKWRAMRANGVAERYCTGDIDAYEKFLAWARTVPYTLRNPLYQWTHLELQRYFDIDVLLDESTAPQVWEQANQQLAGDDLTTQGILQKFGVVALCTTDDPADSLEYHRQIEASSLSTKVFPAYRPDRALRTEDPVEFNQWVGVLAESANIEITSLTNLLEALRRRHDYFHQHGCRLSDHGLDVCYPTLCTEQEAQQLFARVRSGKFLAPEESARFAGFMMLFFGRLDAEKGWTKQLHLGARRNANARMFKHLGRDTGFDSIADWPQADSLAAYLDCLDQENALPKMIVYNLNPSDDYVFATILGNYQDGNIPGKLQFGSAWWFLDQKEGIEWQLNALSNCGLLSRFIGMLTDSRSFMSFPRHEYFRRVLCNLLGNEMESGELPDDEELIGNMVRKICYDNAASYLSLPSIEAVSNTPLKYAGKNPALTQIMPRSEQVFTYAWLVLIITLPFNAAWTEASQQLTVSADGSAQFKFVQQAVDALPETGGIIKISPGTYREVVTINKPHVQLEGNKNDPSKVVLVFNNSHGTVGGTLKSATVSILGDDFFAEGITFSNDFSAGKPLAPEGSQAVALLVKGDRAVFRNVRMLGAQDTLYAGSKSCETEQGPCMPARQYFFNCYIEGNVDFIFGNAQAFFENRQIHAIPHETVFLTAQSKHYPDEVSGYVFEHCTVTAAPGIQHIFLGRPWRPYSTVIFLDTKLKAEIEPAGWREWHLREAHSLDTVFYAEFKSKGKGADASHRDAHSWQLKADQARQFLREQFLAGPDHWDPVHITN